MKAITINQPWASLIILGEKQFETRSWRTHYRGPIAIHAGVKIDKDACTDAAIKRTLEKHGITSYKDLPTSAVLGTAVINECHTVVKDWYEFNVAETDKGLKIDGDEYCFGYYDEGRFAWELNQIEAFPIPMPAKGQLRLWNWECPIK